MAIKLLKYTHNKIHRILEYCFVVYGAKCLCVSMYSCGGRDASMNVCGWGWRCVCGVWCVWCVVCSVCGVCGVYVNSLPQGNACFKTFL